MEIAPEASPWRCVTRWRSRVGREPLNGRRALGSWLDDETRDEAGAQGEDKDVGVEDVVADRRPRRARFNGVVPPPGVMPNVPVVGVPTGVRL